MTQSQRRLAEFSELGVHKLPPYAVRLPDLRELVFSRVPIRAVTEAMQKDERRDAFVRGAMHEYALARARIHHAREPLEILRLRRVELHRDVDVSHALRGDQFAFVRESVVGRGQREVDDDVEARLAQRGEIVRLRHAARGQPVINAQEIADVIQPCRMYRKLYRDTRRKRWNPTAVVQASGRGRPA